MTWPSGQNRTPLRTGITTMNNVAPADIFDVRPLGTAIAIAKPDRLLETDRVKIIHMPLSAGKELKEHSAPGELIVQCVEGRIAFTARGNTVELTAGQMIHLPNAQPHAVRAIDDSTFLLTIVLAEN